MALTFHLFINLFGSEVVKDAISCLFQLNHVTHSLLKWTFTNHGCPVCLVLPTMEVIWWRRNEFIF